MDTLGASSLDVASDTEIDFPVSDAAYDASDALKAAKLSKIYYDDLKRIARSKRRNARLGDTMRTTDLLHHSFVKLMKTDDWVNDNHFMSCAALAMRHVITDHARAKLSGKRGNGAANLPLEAAREARQRESLPIEEIVSVSNKMRKLGELEPLLAKTVDCLYFSGFTIAETAQLLGISDSTVQRNWVKARAWLGTELQSA